MNKIDRVNIYVASSIFGEDDRFNQQRGIALVAKPVFENGEEGEILYQRAENDELVNSEGAVTEIAAIHDAIHYVRYTMDDDVPATIISSKEWAIRDVFVTKKKDASDLPQSTKKTRGFLYYSKKDGFEIDGKALSLHDVQPRIGSG